MSGKPIFVCKECGAKCDHDEINYHNICIDCEKVETEWEGFSGDWIFNSQWDQSNKKGI
jgi:hypothetical protein